MGQKQNMYTDVRTWNPIVGCGYNCAYCKQSFQRMVQRVYFCQGKKCVGCRDFLPHEHPDRLKDRLPTAEILWPCAHGDISFARPEYVKQIIAKVNAENHYRQVYWQSKNPSCFKRYLRLLPENSVLLTTLETNRDDGYELISRAPKPSIRAKAFAEIDWPHKIVTLEPVYDFDPEELLRMLVQISPKAIWIGYNSKNPQALGLGEPSNQKVEAFLRQVATSGIEIKKKFFRKAFVPDSASAKPRAPTRQQSLHSPIAMDPVCSARNCPYTHNGEFGNQANVGNSAKKKA